MRIIIILLSLTSCSTSLYTANTRNTPLFHEQGEAQLSGYISSGGFEAQAAYAFTDHIAAIGSYAFGSSQQSNPDYTHKNGNGEIGVGIYDRSRDFRYEIIGGYGFGSVTDADQYYFYGLNNTVVATAKLQRYFIQPSIGTNGRDFNLIFTPKLEWVNFSDFSIPTSTALINPNEKPQVFFEPALTSKLRLKGNIHAIFQLGVAFSGDAFFEYSKMQASLGLQIDTGGLNTKVFK